MTAPVQPELETYAARRAGELAADACAEKAERVSNFDRSRAADLILECLHARPGAQSGEDLTDYCLARGIEPPDTRAFGAVISKLARSGLIVAVGICKRRRGHGSPGPTWELAN